MAIDVRRDTDQLDEQTLRCVGVMAAPRQSWSWHYLRMTDTRAIAVGGITGGILVGVVTASLDLPLWGVVLVAVLVGLVVGLVLIGVRRGGHPQ